MFQTKKIWPYLVRSEDVIMFLRFFDENGNKIYEPCIMDTTLRFTII